MNETQDEQPTAETAESLAEPAVSPAESKTTTKQTSVARSAGILFSRQFVELIAHGFSPEKAALATTLTQIMFPFILLVALAAVAMGVLNTKGIFGIPASASTVFNVVSIVFGLGLAYWLSG